MRSSRSVGVDFGTTTSLVSEGVAGRQPVIFPIGATTEFLPSLVGLDGGDRILVGDDANALGPQRVKRSIKRCITHHEDEAVLGDGTRIDVDEGITALLTSVGTKARLGGVDLSEETVRLGCPAMWTGPQRQRLVRLAGAAGLPVGDDTLIDEPVAAGVAWVTQQMTARSRELSGKLLVFDMGGGTLDVAILDIHAEPGRVPEISVLSSWGVDEAGDALDEAVARDLTRELIDCGADPHRLESSPGLVMDAARQAKVQLSTNLDAVVAVRAPGIQQPEVTYTREQLDEAFAPQLRRAESLVTAVLRGARVTHEEHQSPSEIRSLSMSDLAKDIDFVLLAGGMARVPAVARLLDRLLPGVDTHIGVGVPPDEAIVAGLGETVAYDRINLHRPPFSFVLEYVEDGKRKSTTVYDAYSPFYPPHFPMTRHVLHYEWRALAGELPRTGVGYLRIFTPGGEPVHLQVDGQVGAVEIPFGHRPPAVLIHPNGRVLIVDGKQARTSFLVPRWPVIRGKDHAILVARRHDELRGPVLDKPWMKDPLFLH